MKKPTTWKDYLKQTTDQVRPKHSWVIVGVGSKRGVRSIYGDDLGDSSSIYIKYKCLKCNVYGIKYISEDIVLEKPEFVGLTCDEVIIKNII